MPPPEANRTLITERLILRKIVRVWLKSTPARNPRTAGHSCKPRSIPPHLPHCALAETHRLPNRLGTPRWTRLRSKVASAYGAHQAVGCSAHIRPGTR